MTRALGLPRSNSVRSRPYYEFQGRRYPRVTRILDILRDPGLEALEAKIGTRAMKQRGMKAANRGTKLDAAIKAEIQGCLKPRLATFEEKQGWKAWEEYKRLYPTQHFEVGQPRCSELWNYAGEPDLLNAEGITDVKATWKIQEKHWIQTNAYIPLIWSEDAWDTKLVQIIRLDTQLGVCEVRTQQFNEGMFTMFLKLKEVYLTWFSQEMEG